MKIVPIHAGEAYLLLYLLPVFDGVDYCKVFVAFLATVRKDFPHTIKAVPMVVPLVRHFFSGCKVLAKITLYGKVKAIGKNAFLNCKKLKTVMKECGIDKPISAHCARHGFATMALTNGMPIESVSRVLGHTNIVTTQIYAKITTKKLDNDLTMLGNKLNASFSNIKTV